MRIIKFNIFHKVLLFSVITLVTTAVIGGVTARLIYDTKFHSRTDSFAVYLGERIAKYGIDSKETKRIINDVERLFSLKIGVYDKQGNLIQGDRGYLPLKMDKELEHSERLQLIFGKTLGFMKDFKIHGKTYFMFMSAIDKHKFLKSIVVLSTVLLMIMLVAYWFAWTLVKPLSKINFAVENFGKGDLSARTELCRKDEIGDLANSFNNMADKIYFLMRSEKELLANISHEIRTPLSRIRIALEISEEVESIEQIKKYLSGIDMDLLELEQMIDDVLTSTKLDFALTHKDGNTFVLRKEPTDFLEIVDASVARFKDHYENKVLIEDIKRDNYFRVEIDKKLIKRVLDNLLDNAVKYSKDEITLRITEGDNSLNVNVIDRGVGLNKKEIESIFNPFYRAEKSRVRSKGGIGLGLTLCKRILKAHGEEIFVESTPEKGSVFTFTLHLYKGTSKN